MATKTQKPKAPDTFEKILARFELTDKEMRELGTEAGNLNAAIERLKDELKSVSSDYKARIETKEGTRSAVCTKLSNGYEMREVRALVVYDPKASTKQYVDPKNKDRVYRDSVPMTHSDFQLPMFSKQALDATKKPEAKKDAQSEPINPVANAVDAATLEAAGKQQKVECDFEGLTPLQMLAAFRDGAKRANWDNKILTLLSKLAKSKAEEGTEPLTDFLKPFVVTK